MRPPAPVISVGNLSVGGTGKTPVVMWLIERLIERSRRPMVAMRGYRQSASTESDEALEYRRRFHGRVVVRAQPDRAAAIAEELARGTADCVVLDDGFQHRRVARDVDIVLLDATRDPFSDRCLPAGWLREPVEALARAHAIVLTRVDRAEPAQINALHTRAAEEAPHAIVARAAHRWAALRVSERGAEREEPTRWLHGRRCVAACGVGHPAAFLAQCRATGAEIAAELVRPDHDPWSPGAQRALVALCRREHCGVVLTTQKDAVKLASPLPASGGGIAVVVPTLEIEFTTGGAELLALVDRALGVA